jgi:hypothetical protein
MILRGLVAGQHEGNVPHDTCIAHIRQISEVTTPAYYFECLVNPLYICCCITGTAGKGRAGAVGSDPRA